MSVNAVMCLPMQQGQLALSRELLEAEAAAAQKGVDGDMSPDREGTCSAS